jgi:hypothetical protein
MKKKIFFAMARRKIMNVKLFFVTVMAALLSMAIIACDPSEPPDEIGNIPPPPLPPPEQWWNQIESGGEIYDDFRYKIEDGGIRIIRYEGEGGTVSIPAEIKEIPVTTIGIYAFRETELTGIVIPDSVTYIGEYAFEKNQLASVVIPDSVTSIGKYAFANNLLTGVVIPNSVTFIESGAFSYNQLTDVVIPDSVTYIGGLAFSGNQLTSVTISENVTEIAFGSFSSNRLAWVVIPNSVTSIQQYAFSENDLVKVTIGKNVSIRLYAFSNFEYIGNNLSTDIENGFAETYNNNGRLAGTYTRPDATSTVWTRQQ